jgi:GT2 family glycosyltransferase
MDGHPECGICVPKVLDLQKKTHFEYAGAAGGYIDRYGYPFCRGRIFESIEEDRGQYDQPEEIFWGTGACLMVKASLFREAGGLDEKFFAHMEEIDLSWRIRRMGYSVYCIPSSTIYHLGGGTLSYQDPRKTYYNFRNNLLLLYKNLPPEKRKKVIFIRMMLDALSALKFLLEGSFSSVKAIWRAHRAYSGMKRQYRGTKKTNNLPGNDVIVRGIYPGSIVADYFLRRKRQFGDLGWSIEEKGENQYEKNK